MNSCFSNIKRTSDVLKNSFLVHYVTIIRNCKVTKYLEFPFFVQNVITKTSKDYYRILLQIIVAYNSPANTIMPFLLSR